MTGVGFTRITSDQIITEGTSLFFGVSIEASADGGDVSVYEGLDSSSGRLIGTFKELANVHTPQVFPYPIACDRGIYVDIGTSVTAVTVFWLPDMGM